MTQFVYLSKYLKAKFEVPKFNQETILTPFAPLLKQ